MFTISEVAGSWPALLDRLDRRAAWAMWARTEPALAAVSGPAELPAVLAHGADPAGFDALLGALVRWAAADGGDDQDAVLLLLHLLAAGAATLAGKVAHRSADSLVLVVGELTCQIRSFPWRRRTRAYAANLLLDTKHALWVGELRPPSDGYRPEDAVPVDPMRWPELDCVVADQASARCPTDAEPELVDMLAWAAAGGVASASDLALLLQWERQCGQGAGTRRQVAAGLGIDERTLRRRRNRILAALRECRDEYLAAAA